MLLLVPTWPGRDSPVCVSPWKQTAQWEEPIVSSRQPNWTLSGLSLSLIAVQKEVTSSLEIHKCVWEQNFSLRVVLQTQLDKTPRGETGHHLFSLLQGQENHDKCREDSKEEREIENCKRIKGSFTN